MVNNWFPIVVCLNGRYTRDIDEDRVSKRRVCVQG